MTKNDVVTRILEELTVHTDLENEVMYPEVRRLVPDLEEDVLESYEEHHVADVLCFELSMMDAEDDALGWAGLRGAFGRSSVTVGRTLLAAR